MVWKLVQVVVARTRWRPAMRNAPVHCSHNGEHSWSVIQSLLLKRFKYTQHKGVKGIRNSKNIFGRDDTVGEDSDESPTQEDISLSDREYDEMISAAMHVSRDQPTAHNVLVIQPYIKWGPKRIVRIEPDDQLREAVALVDSLPNWKVALAMKVALESLDRKALFGAGKLEELRHLVQQLRHGNAAGGGPLSCIFVSKSTLTFAQKRSLENEFQLPVMDRYSLVIQILRLHATSAEARLQVAMAEIPYIWEQAKESNPSATRKQGYSLSDSQRELLKARERKLKSIMQRVRDHRQLLRNKRQRKNYPVVAVVGYTNAGKTSLIKALTAEHALQPRDQLFATLDVTAHMGVLPCNLQVLYMDTVGFMSDLPTGLIECFVATLEDALLADLIVHVQDMAHPCWQAQRQHVEHTLADLVRSLGKSAQLPPVLNVGNKVDLLAPGHPRQGIPDDILTLSAKHNTGVHELLVQVERQLLVATGRRRLKVRVPNGGGEMAWLYKHAAVMTTEAHVDRPDQLMMDVVITDTVLTQFKRTFCR